MEQTVIRQGMALDEYIRRMDDDREPPFEIIDGEIVLMSPSTYGSDHMAWVFIQVLNPFVAANRLGYLSLETTFVLPNTDSSSWVTGSRKPDVMFIVAERLSAYKLATPDWEDRPLALVPDLVIEVISPTDRMDAVLQKVARYLADGVQIVWVANRKRQSITVYTLTNEPVVLSGDQTLSGGEIIPDFTIPVRAIFEYK